MIYFRPVGRAYWGKLMPSDERILILEARVEMLKVKYKKLRDEAWRARTFTMRDEYNYQADKVKEELDDLKWRLSWLKNPPPPKDPSEKPTEPPPEGTVEYLLYLLGE